MNPLAELKRLLATRAGRRTGTVLSIEAGRARVATAAGVEIAALGGGAVSAGDRVAIEQGNIVGRLSSEPAPIYEI